jgi:hypothetical protein
VADESKHKRERAGAKAMPQYEADAQAVREKTERLRALRLARDGADKPAGATPANRRIATKKKSGKPGEKTPPLSEWLAARDQDGQRS